DGFNAEAKWTASGARRNKVAAEYFRERNIVEFHETHAPGRLDQAQIVGLCA
ncbi:MAG: hypothetical protein ACI9G5_002115, partial [Paracoccaceae bacterium]